MRELNCCDGILLKEPLRNLLFFKSQFVSSGLVLADRIKDTGVANGG